MTIPDHDPMTDDIPVIEDFGYVLSGARRGASLSGASLVDALTGAELAWAHLTFSAEHPEPARAWIGRVAPGLDAATVGAMTGLSTRPRAVSVGQGAMVLLRDTPEEVGDDADDMPSIRLYLDARMVVSLSRRPARSLLAEAEAAAHGHCGTTPAGFLNDLTRRIADNAEEQIEMLADRTDRLEEASDSGGDGGTHRQEATDLRRAVLALRRYLAPQRDALEALRGLDMVPKPERRKLAEVHDRNVRAVEELDLLTNRLILVREAIASAQAERLNRQLYILSIVSVLFLPLGFLTGLMGINLGGMPGADDPAAFWIFCGLLAAVFAGLVAILWRMRWF